SSASSFRGPVLCSLPCIDIFLLLLSKTDAADYSFVGLIMASRPPNRFMRAAKSDVPPTPSPVGFSSHTSTAYKFFGSLASTRAVFIIHRLLREKTEVPFGGDFSRSTWWKVFTESRSRRAKNRVSQSLSGSLTDSSRNSPSGSGRKSHTSAPRSAQSSAKRMSAPRAPPHIARWPAPIPH